MTQAHYGCAGWASPSSAARSRCELCDVGELSGNSRSRRCNAFAGCAPVFQSGETGGQQVLRQHASFAVADHQLAPAPGKSRDRAARQGFEQDDANVSVRLGNTKASAPGIEAREIFALLHPGKMGVGVEPRQISRSSPTSSFEAGQIETGENFGFFSRSGRRRGTPGAAATKVRSRGRNVHGPRPHDQAWTQDPRVDNSRARLSRWPPSCPPARNERTAARYDQFSRTACAHEDIPGKRV